MNSKQFFFNELIKRVDFLNQNPERDNEATRHDQLIYPILTSEFGLGWNPTDLISQSAINVPKKIIESHIFRNAIPKRRKPDILICPPVFDRNIAVIEEKNKQLDIDKLNQHRLQAHEYQALYQCTWGILTDGEKWIVKRNFETFHEFSSIYELIKGIEDLKNCLSRSAVIERIVTHNTTDILVIVKVPRILPADSEIFGFENKYYAKLNITISGLEIYMTGETYGWGKNPVMKYNELADSYLLFDFNIEPFRHFKHFILCEEREAYDLRNKLRSLGYIVTGTGDIDDESQKRRIWFKVKPNMVFSNHPFKITEDNNQWLKTK